jgi:hypothetical protein
MLIPREIDPVEAGARMPMPLPRPVGLIAGQHQPKVAIAARASKHLPRARRHR